MSVPTRKRLIDTALARFYRDGFRNVGLDQILADVGISKTAFYKHFDSKEDLMLAALEEQHQGLESMFDQLVVERGGPSPVEQLRAVFDVVEDIIAMDTFHGCLFVNVSMEFPLQHEPAHVAAARNKREIEAFVRKLAERAGAADPKSMAQELCLIMEGAYVTRHVTGNAATIEIARRLAERVIAGYLGRGAGR